MPMTEHSAEILAGAWPSQSVMAWSGYAMQFSQAVNNLFKELDVQMDIKQILAPMEGAFIDAARGLEAGRETALPCCRLSCPPASPGPEAAGTCGWFRAKTAQPNPRLVACRAGAESP